MSALNLTLSLLPSGPNWKNGKCIVFVHWMCCSLESPIQIMHIFRCDDDEHTHSCTHDLVLFRLPSTTNFRFDLFTFRFVKCLLPTVWLLTRLLCVCSMCGIYAELLNTHTHKHIEANKEKWESVEYFCSGRAGDDGEEGKKTNRREIKREICPRTNFRRVCVYARWLADWLADWIAPLTLTTPTCVGYYDQINTKQFISSSWAKKHVPSPRYFRLVFSHFQFRLLHKYGLRGDATARTIDESQFDC